MSAVSLDVRARREVLDGVFTELTVQQREHVIDAARAYKSKNETDPFRTLRFGREQDVVRGVIETGLTLHRWFAIAAKLPSSVVIVKGALLVFRTADVDAVTAATNKVKARVVTFATVDISGDMATFRDGSTNVVAYVDMTKKRYDINGGTIAFSVGGAFETVNAETGGLTVFVDVLPVGDDRARYSQNVQHAFSALAWVNGAGIVDKPVKSAHATQSARALPPATTGLLFLPTGAASTALPGIYIRTPATAGITVSNDGIVTTSPHAATFDVTGAKGLEMWVETAPQAPPPPLPDAAAAAGPSSLLSPLSALGKIIDRNGKTTMQDALIPPGMPSLTGEQVLDLCFGPNGMYASKKASFFEPAKNNAMIAFLRGLLRVGVVNQKTFAQVFVLNKDEVDWRHVMWRVPVYYGQALRGSYDDRVLKQLQDANTDEALKVKRTGAFVIAGHVNLAKTPEYTVLAVHGWGLDFETRDTDDSKTYTSRGHINKDAARIELSRRVRLWIQAALSKAADFGSQRIHFRMPAVGLGQFLSELHNNDDKLFVAMTLLKALETEATTSHGRVFVEICDRDDVIFTKLKVPRDYIQSDHVSIVPGANLFDERGIELHPESPHLAISRLINGERVSRTLTLMNAWDPVAFIGNGGSTDKTVDGFFVANYGPNEHFGNAAYLQNPVFHPEWVNKDTWVQMS